MIPIWAVKAYTEMKLRKITNRQLSEETGIEQTTISKLLNGHRQTETDINKICKYLEIER